MRYPTLSKNHNSLMTKYLSREVFEKYKNLKTKDGFTFMQTINSGLENPDSEVGIYATHQEAYTLYKEIFNPIIQEYHGFAEGEKHKSNMDINFLHVKNLDPTNEYILSTRIRVARNLKDFPLGTAISQEDRKRVEQIVSKALQLFKDDLKGSYYSLSDINEEEKQELIKEHFLFKQGDRFLEKAGLNRNWPEARGIYHNKDKSFLVWINEEDQLRIISMQKGANIQEVFQRLVKAIKELEKSMEFAYDEHLGYITSCPTNLGTTMRASVHIKLSKLSQNKTMMQRLCEKHHLQIRGVHGEHSKTDDGIYDISNKRRLGITEIEALEDLSNGVRALIEAEKSL